jgi:antitoxin component of MazEF toxin-antitoxin module
MKRKLIPQGGSSLTLYLPKNWVDKNNLKAGEEVDVDIAENNVIVFPSKSKHEKKKISLVLPKKESIARTLLVNAYRAGFDVIEISGADIKFINHIAEKFLVGFEAFRNNEKIVLESVSEPSYEEFNNLVQKQFFLLEEVITDFDEEYVLKIQKYDNFLKRCISKGIFSHKAGFFLWQLLSELTHSARLILHSKKKFSGDEKDVLQQIKEMIVLLRTAFLKNDVVLLEKIHHVHDSLMDRLNKNVDLALIVKQVYLVNSPLIGFIELSGFSKSF